MSESLNKKSALGELEIIRRVTRGLVKDADSISYADFDHRTLTSISTFAGPGAADVLTVTLPKGLNYIITAIDIKTLFNPTDADLAPVGSSRTDWRATDDLNPWGPLFGGASAVGVIKIAENGKDLFPAQPDIALINASLMLVMTGTKFTINVNPLQPAGKSLVLVTRVNGYVVESRIGTLLKRIQTQFSTGTTIAM